jgi:integration host factor subunit alpha
MNIPGTLTKNELIIYLSSKFDLKQKDAEQILNNLFEEMIATLAMGTELNLSGFGNFILRNKKSRIGRNPNTKEEFPIPARRVVSFHTSPKLRKFLKNN